MRKASEIWYGFLLIALALSYPSSAISQKSTKQHFEDIKDKISKHEKWDLLYQLEINTADFLSGEVNHRIIDLEVSLRNSGLKEGQIMYLKAYCAFQQDSLDLALKFIQQVSSEDRIAHTLAVALRGGIFYYRGNYLESYRDHFGSQAVFNEIGHPHPLTNRNLYALAIVTKKLDIYAEAQKYGLEALAMAEDLNNQSMVASCNNTLGSLNRLLDSYDSSISHYEVALKYARENNDEKNTRRILNNLGLVLKDAGNFNSALNYLDSSEVIARSMADSSAIATILSNRGAVYHDSGLFLIAENYYLQSLELKRQLGKKIPLITTLNDLAEVRIAISSSANVIELLEESEEISRNYKRKNLLAKSLHLQSDYYEKNGALQQALAAYKESRAIEDEIRSDEINRTIFTAQVQFETSKKEQEIKLLESENAAALLRNKISFSIIIGITFLALLILGFAFHFWRSRTRIQAAHSEIKLLYREMNHRVKNNLQLLADLFSLQSRQAEDEGAKEALITGHARVKAMNVLHHTLDSKIDKRIVQLDSYLSDLVNNLQLAFNPEVELNIHLEQIQVKIDKAIPLGLIVNEAVTNSFKYGMRSEGAELRLEMSQSDGILLIKVQDNGSGFDKEKNRRSFGIRMMESMARQVRATLNYENSGGAAIVLKMPLD